MATPEGMDWGQPLTPGQCVVTTGEAARAAIEPEILAGAEGPVVVVEFPVTPMHTPEEMEAWVAGKGIEGEAARRGVQFGKDARDMKPEPAVTHERESSGETGPAAEAAPFPHGINLKSSPEQLAEAEEVLRQRKRASKNEA